MPDGEREEGTVVVKHQSNLDGGVQVDVQVDVDGPVDVKRVSMANNNLMNVIKDAREE